MLHRIARIDQRRLATILGACIVGFGVMGAFYIRDANYIHGGWVGKVHLFGYHVKGFNLDGEMNLPTAFSGLLLVAASAAGLIVSTRSSTIGIPAARLVPVALLIGYMSLDEVWQFHERLETWFGIDWQALYLPVFAVAGIIGLSLLPHLRKAGSSAALFVAGAAAWGVAQVIEALQWDAHDHLRAAWSIVPEETLEMTGSLLFLLAFLALARHIVAVEATRAPSTDPRPRAAAAPGPTPLSPPDPPDRP